jgi:putative ABC transport system permease protein
VLVPVTIRPAEISVGTLLLAGAAGIVTALLAALLPALRAAADEPADAVRRVPPRGELASRLVHLATCFLLLSIGLTAIVLRQHLPHRMGTYGGLVLVLLGLLLTSPLLAALLTKLLQPLARRLLSIEFRLAADNLARAPGRTGLVIAALAAGVALMIQTAGVTRSNETPIMRWIDSTATADLFVTGGGPINSGSTNVALGANVGQALEKVPGVQTVLPIRFRRPDFRNTVVFLIAFDARTYCDVNRQRHLNEGLDGYERLTEPGTVLISENFSVLHDVHEGDSITLTGPQGPFNLRVVGKVVDFSWNRGTVVVDRRTYQENFHDSLVDVFDVYYHPDETNPAAVQASLKDWCKDKALVVTTRTELLSYLQELVRRLFGIAYLQIGVVGIVAGLGVVTALLISILQRRRELGLLRAVGATRSQVLRSVLAEALLMGIIGTALGVLFGLPMEWYIVRVIMLEESGFVFPMLIPWIEGAGIAALAIVTATLAGFGPAAHAVRMPITEAIAYE